MARMAGTAVIGSLYEQLWCVGSGISVMSAMSSSWRRVWMSCRRVCFVLELEEEGLVVDVVGGDESLEFAMAGIALLSISLGW